jgi:5-methylcytosine-specific restriction endonuclease McrA
MTWVNRLRNRAPLTAITCERVRFDTQKLICPEIHNVEYQQGTLFGYEVREYLLEKWGRQCAYCDIQNIPLQIDHMVPKSCGGSNRIDNLTLACASCNQKKGNLPLEIFSPKRAKKLSSTPPLQGAAAVNATRNALWEELTELSLPCEAGTGGQTKYNRNYFGVPKTHALDAACTGTVSQLQNWQVPTQRISCTGRGSYQRTRSDRFGFPRGVLLRQKKVQGFQTGDQVISSVLSGKKKGCYAGRVAIRASGYFNIQTANGVVQGINSKDCRLVQHADGYHYLGNLSTNLNQQTEEQRFLPALKGQVSALSF